VAWPKCIVWMHFAAVCSPCRAKLTLAWAIRVAGAPWLAVRPRQPSSAELTMTSPVLASLDPRGVATVTLNRPEVGNAYNGDMIEGLLAAMDDLAGKPHVRAVLLKGNGRHFQAGADLKWIRQVRDASAAENERVSRATAQAVDRLNRLSVPTVALV